MAASSVLSSAITATYYNMILQLLFRVLTFLMNAFILRSISKDLLGIVNVRLTLLTVTIQLVSREAFRRACLSSTSEKKEWKQTINLLWLVLPIGLAWSCIFGCVWIYVLEQPDPTIVPHYRMGVIAFSIATIIEHLSEPLYVVGQILLFVRLKVFIEGISLAIRCVLTVMFVKYFPHLGLQGFSIAQIVFATSIMIMYYGYFIWYMKQKDKDFPFRSIRDVFPHLDTEKALIKMEQASLTWSFFKQSFLKQILTDGEKYVMTVFNLLSFGDQGIFDVITNLGSLAPRIIFLQLEDGGYLFFTKTLKRGIPAKGQEPDAMRVATSYLKSLLKIVLLLGVTIVVFGYAYSFLLLDIYGGQVLSSGRGPLLLRWFCVYVLLLAINGTTECFSFATMSKEEVERYNYKMFVFSILFLGASCVLTGPFGSVGFILANCLNMIARIIHSIYHMRKYFYGVADNPLSGLKLSLPVLVMYACSFLITSISETKLCAGGLMLKILHICIGGLCLLIVMLTVWLCESDLVMFMKSLYRERSKRKEKKM